MNSIALFGTSADPPTLGHQAIVEWLSLNFAQVFVWASNNPFKTHATSLSNRIAMLELMMNDIAPYGGNVRLQPELSFPRTLDTVQQARQLWPQAEFTLVIGSDLVDQLPKWYCVSELLSQVALLVIPRPGYVLGNRDWEALKQLGARMAIADLTGLNTSSTAYRENKDTEGVSPSIAAYIEREQLYTCQDHSQTTASN
jgi:nicotinate-nucleotide adenylyltransferase